MKRSVPARLKKLFQAASRARLNAYSPYSGQKVGAALRTNQGKIFSGCNIENSSYGGTNCAERVAIQSAIASVGEMRIAELLVVTDATPPWPPCGLCRQVISEFGPDAVIHAANTKGEIHSFTLDELLPEAFKPDHLLRAQGKR